MENNDKVIEAVKEEYEKKLEEQRLQFEEEKKKALEEQEEKHIRQIKALISGRNPELGQEKEVKTDEEEFTDKVNFLVNKFNKR